MAKLKSKLGSWELEHVHMWRERGGRIRAAPRPFVGIETKIATIGSCFAQELAGSLARFGIDGGMHPGGLYYNSRSIRQELERMSGEWPGYADIEPWAVADGFVHPLKNLHSVHPDREALATWCDEVDGEATDLFTASDVIVVTLGLVESWVDPTSGTAYRQIPHPEVFDQVSASFHRQNVAEIEADLDRILEIVEGWGARLVVTVSPVPLNATMTPLDVRVANAESKGRIRAAVSQFIERNPQVGYFHSYEIVATAERTADFMREDGRHVRRRAVDLIVHEFLTLFGDDELELEEVDDSWVTQPDQTAARPRRSALDRLRGQVERLKS